MRDSFQSGFVVRFSMAFVSVGLTVLMGCANTASSGAHEPTEKAVSTSESHVVLRSEVEWSPLNPARGDASPQAGTLWGDRAGQQATGFLVKFADGFSSPPHIHNVTYRGMVIQGRIHNDDPQAEHLWLPAGSFWTQPAGEAHITAAQGEHNLAYIEIDEGPYLVHPAEQAFDNGERPINVDRTNLVWLDASEIRWASPFEGVWPQGVQIAFLWGSPEPGAVNGTLVKWPAGFRGELKSGSVLRAVLIQGRARYHEADGSTSKRLDPGSYFGSLDASSHSLSIEPDGAAIFYVRSDGPYSVNAKR